MILCKVLGPWLFRHSFCIFLEDLKVFLYLKTVENKKAHLKKSLLLLILSHLKTPVCMDQIKAHFSAPHVLSLHC